MIVYYLNLYKLYFFLNLKIIIFQKQIEYSNINSGCHLFDLNN